MVTRHPDKQARLDAILEHTAETLGDIAPLVLARFYHRHPDARQAFRDHGYDKVERLEREMVDSALYCLMLWYERPSEIEILLSEAVPHHQYLNIPATFFSGLQEAVLDVIGSALDATDVAARELIAELKQQLVAVIAAASEPPALGKICYST